ncbi:MAG: 3-alpha-hydroxysteroid dehydrogenase [Acidimicrobiales bacterium]|nr:3-alpha-hydroxysteroid dehydrogenase [Acidimicrobiales bacterium]
MGRLDGKVALITGAARGSGASTAELFAAEGAKVVVTDILDDLGRELVANIGPAAIYERLDITDESRWSEVVDVAVETFGSLDVMVNNAAILEFGSLLDTTLDAFKRTVDVNQVGVFLGMRTAVPAMREAGGGSIINISSVDGLRGLNGVFAYASTKWAVRGMTKCAAMELGHLGIRVNSVHPGGVRTPMNDPHIGDMDIDAMFANLPIPRLMEPEEVAQLNLFLASDESSYCTAADFTADGGWTAGVREPALPGLEISKA